MKGRTFKFSELFGRCRPKFWKPTEFPGEESESDLLKKKTHLEVMHHILLEMLHVGLELTSWSWLITFWTTMYKFVSTNPSATGPFCPQMGSSLIMCMLKSVQKSVLQVDVPWLPAFLETSSNLTIFEWDSFQKTIKHFRWMMGVTSGTPRCWKFRWSWKPLNVDDSSLKEEDFYFTS